MPTELNEKMAADANLDVRGLGCPMPLLKAKKAIEALDSGKILEVVGTDPGSKNDFASWAERTGNEYLGSLDVEDHFIFYLKRK